MKLWRHWHIILIAASLGLAGAFYFVTTSKKDVTTPKNVPRIETLAIVGQGGIMHTFKVEVADTPETEASGLMFRTHMEPDHGMLFEMGRIGVVSFWMKNTMISLDMLFISADGRIKKIHENAVPRSLERISSEIPVKAVLEINGGLSEVLGIAEGDQVIHPYFKNQKP